MSNKKKLTEIEIESIRKFIDRYDKFNTDLEKYQSSLEEVEMKKQDLMNGLQNMSNQLDKVRAEEEKYTADLVKKYGKFTLNLENFEITIDETTEIKEENGNEKNNN